MSKQQERQEKIATEFFNLGVQRALEEAGLAKVATSGALDTSRNDISQAVYEAAQDLGGNVVDWGGRMYDRAVDDATDGIAYLDEAMGLPIQSLVRGGPKMPYGISDAVKDIRNEMRQLNKSASVYEDYAQASTMAAEPGRVRRSKQVAAPEPEPELPDFTPLWQDFQVGEFADLPENYQFDANADPEEVQKYIDSGNQYISQAQQVYAYLLKQGMNAKDAAAQAKQLVARNFQRYTVNR